MNNQELFLSYPLLLVWVRLQGGPLVFSCFTALGTSCVSGGCSGGTRRGGLQMRRGAGRRVGGK